VKTCQCGCGQPTPARFLRGHHLRASHPAWWKGDAAGYRAIHTYLQKHFPKTGICDECGKSGEATDHALLKGHTHSRDRADYRELCRSCHMIYDGVIGADGVRARGAAARREQAGEAPRCQCGCGSQVGWNRKHSNWQSYAAGHYVGPARLLRKAG